MKKKVVIPENLQSLSSLAKENVAAFLETVNKRSGKGDSALIRIDGICFLVNSGDGYTDQKVSQGHSYLAPAFEGHSFWKTSRNIYALGDDKAIYQSCVEIGITSDLTREDSYRNSNQMSWARVSISPSRWKRLDHIKIWGWQSSKLCLFSNDEIMSLLEKKNPYTAQFAKEKGYDPMSLYLFPELEQLSKCGFRFADCILEGRGYALGRECTETIETYLRRLLKHGSSPKEIFKMPMELANALKDECDMRKWDTFRKMVHTGKLTASQAKDMYRGGYNKDQLNFMNSILIHEYDGKKVFTMESLLRYLERVDNFEAIPLNDALSILKDYLQCCRVIGQKPCIDGDSLKREHDVTARIAANKRNCINAERLKKACMPLKRFDFSEDGFLARSIRDYDDLVDEARQQHNCLVGYQNNIMRGHSLIMVVRRKETPEKSLASVELDPDTGRVRQKYLAYNREIRDPELTEFIRHLSSHVSSVLSEEAATA